MSQLPARCPMAAPARTACAEALACRADPAAPLPREGPERAVMLALRFVAAAAETGDAACFDAAFDGAEAEFGSRDGALLVARAAALLRTMRRDGEDLRSLPPPCRYLSAGEADLLAALRLRMSGHRGVAEHLSGAMRAALSDLAAPILPHRTPAGLPLLAVATSPVAACPAG